MEINKDLVAPCGLYCGACGIYIAHKTNNKKLKEKLASVYNSSVDELHCQGCMSQDEDKIYFYCKMCPIKTCTKEKGYEGCYQCDDFPCQHIDNFPIAAGKKVILKSVPNWKELGTEEWVRHEEKRYTCSDCDSKLIRGARACNKCKKPMEID